MENRISLKSKRELDETYNENIMNKNGNVTLSTGSLISNRKWRSLNFPETSSRPLLGNETKTQPSLSELSHSSSPNSSFEAVGGSSGTEDLCDLQYENSELRFQVQKLSDECSDLKEQNAVFQDENIQLLSQKEELERKISLRDLGQERIRQLQKEINDSRNTLSSVEDLNSVLSTRIQRLERDYAELQERNNILNKECQGYVSDLSTLNIKLKVKDEEINKIKRTAKDNQSIVTAWIGKEKLLQNRLNEYQETINELNATINELRKEKIELENNIVDISGNQLAELNNSSPDGTSSESSSPESLQFTRCSLRKSLQAEIAATIQNNKFASTGSLTIVTQSCPLELAPMKRPSLTNCSTQTDTAIGHQTQSSNQIGDENEKNDENMLDKLTEDKSYRLAINLPTVLEESEQQETETSPGAGPRRMSSIEGSRRNRKLIRSPNAHDEDLPEASSDPSNRGDDLISTTSDNDFKSSLPGSFNSSVYNSLERPLQTTGGYGLRNRHSISLVSEGTPLGGSFSQETITNMDGDKTPVNEGNGFDLLGFRSSPISSNRMDHENGTRKLNGRSSSWGPSLPIYNPNETSPVGVIPESDKEHMIRYAYDPVRRSSEREARLLSGEDWRTLRKDLDKRDYNNFRKQSAQQEGNDDIEGGLAVEIGSQRNYEYPDLEEDAEECLEKFPGLVEELFLHLDVLKRNQKSPTDFDLETISTRFNHLAHTFKVEHCNLTQRKDINFSKNEHSKEKMNTILESLIDMVEKFDDVAKKTKVPEEISQLTTSLKHIPGDLRGCTDELAKSSRRVGMMDVQVRLYKMIEVMVLYVHILKNLCAEKDKDFQSARELLKKNNIPYARTKTVTSMNNNNNGKVSMDEGESDDGESLMEDQDGRPKQLLQHLLGPKKSNVDLDYKLREKLVLSDKKSNTKPIIKLVADIYETLRCEFFWPWNWEETWKGMKQGFSVILMVIGFFIIVRSLFPIVSADTKSPVADLSSVFSKHGNLDHSKIPPV